MQLDTKFDLYLRKAPTVQEITDDGDVIYNDDAGPWELKQTGHNLTVNQGLDGYFNGAVNAWGSLGQAIALGTGTQATEAALLSNVTLAVTTSGGNFSFDAGQVIGSNANNRVTIVGLDGSSNLCKFQGRVLSAVGNVWTCEYEAIVGPAIAGTYTATDVRLFYTTRTGLQTQVVQSTTQVSGENFVTWDAVNFRLNVQRSILFGIEVTNMVYNEVGWRVSVAGVFTGIAVLPTGFSVPIGYQAKTIVNFYHNYDQTSHQAVANFNSGVDMSGTFAITSSNIADSLFWTNNSTLLPAATGGAATASTIACGNFLTSNFTLPAQFSNPSAPIGAPVALTAINQQTYTNGSGRRAYNLVIGPAAQTGTTFYGIVLNGSNTGGYSCPSAILKFTTPFVKPANYTLMAQFTRRVLPKLLT